MPTNSTNELMEKFHRFLSKNGFRQSQTRDQVAKVFFRTSSHIGVEDLFDRVRKKHPRIGIATVYRTLSLLVESGLAHRRDFETGSATYEKQDEKHHDHLICQRCGKIVEFHVSEIEELQDQVARQHGFSLRSHKMELYGICGTCNQG